MNPADYELVLATERYHAARRKAILQDLMARLRGDKADLLPYQAIEHVLQAYQHVQLAEFQTIPLDRIVGSVGRSEDFTRGFLPRGAVSSSRWARVDAAMGTPEGLPPIEVYKVGSVYFVSDGNHRVSVARANHFKGIDAWVNLVPVDPGIEPGDSLDEAIVKAECIHFLAQTRLGIHCTDVPIVFRRPGGYPQLIEHIYAHAFLANQARPEGERLSFPGAARDWYERVYLPFLEVVHSEGLLRGRQDCTPAELYVSLDPRLLTFDEEAGLQVDVPGLVERFRGGQEGRASRFLRSLTKRLR